MADDPLPELDGKTPMEAARTPNMDTLAEDGSVGLVNVTPPGMYPGSDAANMSLLGYDPLKYYTGRGPVEAAAMRIPMDPKDVAFRCSIISTDGTFLTDYSAGHISTENARPIIELASKLCGRARKLFVGVQYRHILLWNNGPMELKTNAPHENMGAKLEEILPVGESENRLRQFIWDSYEMLNDLPYNKERIGEGLPPANMLWPWGQGRSPQLPSFFSRHERTGAVFASVDVIKGLGRLTGLEVVDVPGATGYYDTDYRAKAMYALDYLKKLDFAWVHVESPDEAGHEGNIDRKIEAIERIDKLVVGTLIDGMKKLDHYRMLIVPDHATPVKTRGQKAVAVPYLMYDSDGARKRNTMPFDERLAQEKATLVDDGFRLIDGLFKH